jgi:phosphoglycerate-specific signal transduction histidine kinase
MSWDAILETLWTVLNSPAVITALAGLLLYGLNKLYLKKSLWQQFEGTVVAAVKLAEKEIPNDVANKSLQRLDTALRYVLKVYEEARGRKATAAEVAQLKDGIQLKHAELESRGTV